MGRGTAADVAGPCSTSPPNEDDKEFDMQVQIGRRLLALLLIAIALLPAQAFAQSCTTSTAYYGTLMRTADLDGNGSLEAVCNAYSEINVLSGTVATRYPLTNVYWTLADIVDVDGLPGAEVVLQQGTQITIIKHYSRRTTVVANMGNTWSIGGFADVDGSTGKEIIVTDQSRLRIVYGNAGSVTDHWIGASSRVAAGAISEMDGNAGMEIPLESGSNLLIYGRYTGLRSTWITTGTNWKVCTDIANCASDMNGVAGAELLLALPSEVRIYSLRSGTMSSYWIGAQYATLRDGVRSTSLFSAPPALQGTWWPSICKRPTVLQGGCVGPSPGEMPPSSRGCAMPSGRAPLCLCSPRMRRMSTRWPPWRRARV
jgi:hypothetical protein